MSAINRVAARGYQFRLILEKPVPAHICHTLNALWREKWGNNVFTPNLSMNGKRLYGSYTDQPVRDLISHGCATDDELKAVSTAVWEEGKVMSDLFQKGA